MKAKALLIGFLGVMTVVALANPARAEGDPAAGEKVFRKCASCHSAIDAKNKIGPSLKGVYGRKAGEVADFKYSDAMKASGIVWDDAKLAAYLKDPAGFVKGNKMTFVGLKDDKDIADVTAYLKQQK
jgi:cytochrome c